MMTRTQSFLAVTSLALLVACGGSSSKPQASEPTATAPAADPAGSEGVAGGVGYGIAAPLPEIPQSPAAAPTALTAEISLSNPNQQLTQIGTFADAVQPGIGSFVTPQSFMQAVGGMVKSDGLTGADLNKPVHIVLLDDEAVVLIVSVKDEAELGASVAGGSRTIFHNGYAAIGSTDALTIAAPYALSNLVTQPTIAEPVFTILVPSILNGPKGAEVRSDIQQNVGDPNVAKLVLAGLEEIKLIRTTLDANQGGATIRMTAEVAADGNLKEFLGRQRASDFSIMNSIGTGPWGLVAAGRIDLGSLSPMLTKIVAREGNALLSQAVGHLLGLNGDMAIAINPPKNPELVMAMNLGADTGSAKLLSSLLTLLSKQPGMMDMMGMKVSLKMNSFKAKGAGVHELKFKPTSDELKELYGKKGVSAFVGIVGDRFVATFGAKSKKQAKALANGKANKKGKGKKLQAALRLAQSAQESFLVTIDLLALQGVREPKDISPLAFGLRFTETSATLRIEMPTDFIKEAVQNSSMF